MKTTYVRQETRFVAKIDEVDMPEFREELVNLNRGFTEIATAQGKRFIVALSDSDSKQCLLDLLDRWKQRTRDKNIVIEDQVSAPDKDEIFLLLPLLRNPEEGIEERSTLYSNEQMTELVMKLAKKFYCLPQMVHVYGEYRNKAGELIPDPSMLIRVPQRTDNVVSDLRRFIRDEILSHPDCDQECIYLSFQWKAELIYRESD